ncbi:M28 family peptidase [Candidatus Thorarchaeota archaeon]|nr:MAG: M28 family peptidase [Candidatus Thorarchaeota archaeon]
MASRKAKAALLVIVVVSTVFVGSLVLNRLFQTDEDDGGQTQIEPHPYNALNWWDVAKEIAKTSNMLTPLGRIVGFGNRHLENPNTGYYDAADYLIDLLGGWGLEAQYFGNHDSVLSRQVGYGNDSRAIVFGAHLDSNENGVGVNQNAGGCAVVTMIADILRNYRLPVDIYYCYFSYNTVFLDEQQRVRAMYGSKEIAQHFVDEDIDVMAFYNFDELLFYNENQDETESLIAEHHSPVSRGYHQTQYLAELMQAFLRNSGHNFMSIDDELNTQTDHWAFWDRGLPAVNIKSGHRIDPEFPPQDSLYSEDYNRDHAFELGKAAAALAVYLASSGNGETISFKLEKPILPGSSSQFRTVISFRQTIQLTSISNSTEPISLRIQGGNDTVLPTTDFDNGSVTLTTEQQADLGPLSVKITNIGNATIYIEVHIFYQNDHDGNGIVDSEQYTWSEPDPPLDWDKDGLSDKDEEVYGTDIFVRDTDQDGMPDGFEVAYDLNPLLHDSKGDLDEDGLDNIREMQLGTAANNNDTDADGMPDGWEVMYGTDPLVDDALEDFDADNLTNLEEYMYGADPYLPDSDFDGITDAEEVERGTDPMNPDSDEDGLRDLLELIEGLDPLWPDYDFDLLPDGSDPNPKINGLLMILALAAIPVAIGSIFFYRRLYK